MRAIKAVGPIVISLQLPKIAYIKHPMNAEYRPYCKNRKKIEIIINHD